MERVSAGDGVFVLEPVRAGQHVVGVARRVGHHVVHGDHQLEFGEDVVAQRVRVAPRAQRVAGVHPQRLRLDVLAEVLTALEDFGHVHVRDGGRRRRLLGRRGGLVAAGPRHPHGGAVVRARLAQLTCECGHRGTGHVRSEAVVVGLRAPSHAMGDGAVAREVRQLHDDVFRHVAHLRRLRRRVLHDLIFQQGERRVNRCALNVERAFEGRSRHS